MAKNNIEPRGSFIGSHEKSIEVLDEHQDFENFER